MKEVLLEIYKSAKERFKYPIISIYVVVLILWNWDVLSYYFLSESKIEDKIEYIETEFNNSYSRILYPLLKAIILAVTIPALMWIIESVLFYVNRNRRNIRIKVNNQIRIDKEAQAEHEFIIQEKRTGTLNIRKLDQKIASLQQENEIQSENYQEQINRLNHFAKEQTESIKKHQESINNIKHNRDSYAITISNSQNFLEDIYGTKEEYNRLINKLGVENEQVLNLIKKSFDIYTSTDYKTTSIQKHKSFVYNNIDDTIKTDIMNWLVNNYFIEVNDSTYTLKAKGIVLYEYLYSIDDLPF